ncbi:MAG: hypothetical protein JW955_16085 [Sedimentisphaerales bacterium]|nr:hypothetical protein [Sedimentisphaerales bacterium]
MRGFGFATALLLVALLCSGCGPSQADVSVAESPPAQTATETAGADADKAVEPLPVVPAGFCPAKVCILPLTELLSSTGSNQAVTLNAFIGLLDAFGCQIKAPYVLRFELYQYVPRSAQPKGQRLAIWPDIDLTHPATNNKYWRDFLRAYEFRLDAPMGLSEMYVLEATCMCPDGRRLTAKFPLRGGQ